MAGSQLAVSVSCFNLAEYDVVDLLRSHPSAGEQLLEHPRSKLGHIWSQISSKKGQLGFLEKWCENQGFVTNRVKLLECLEHLMGMEWSQSPIEGADGGPEGGDDDHLLHHLLLLAAA